MKWVNIDTPPSKSGFYFCWHERWGRVVMGYADGWGAYEPRMWLCEDELPSETPSADCQKILRDGSAIGMRGAA